jgi:Family of unknown function (DUF5335)
MDRRAPAGQDDAVGANGRASTETQPGGLDGERWSEYFDSLSNGGDHLLAAIEPPGSDDDRDGYEPQRPLHAIRYDANADEIELAVGIGIGPRAALRYFVSAPRSIVVEELDEVKVLRVVDASGLQTLIRVSAASAERRDRLAQADVRLIRDWAGR